MMPASAQRPPAAVILALIACSVTGAIALQSTNSGWRLLACSACASSDANSSAAAGIHHRKNDFAFLGQIFDRSHVGQARLPRQRLAACAALIERGADVISFLLELLRDCLPHVAGAHDADVFDFHALISDSNERRDCVLTVADSTLCRGAFAVLLIHRALCQPAPHSRERRPHACR